jgi:hypothetical protein
MVTPDRKRRYVGGTIVKLTDRDARAALSL